MVLKVANSSIAAPAGIDAAETAVDDSREKFALHASSMFKQMNGRSQSVGDYLSLLIVAGCRTWMWVYGYELYVVYK